MTVAPPLDVPPVLPDELLPLEGTDWNRVHAVRDVDGDTVRILRQQLTWELVETCELGDALLLTDWKLRVTEDDPEELPDGLSGRLIQLNTPERGKQLPRPLPDGRAGTWAEACDDLWAWVERNCDRLRCVTYDQAGGFDRLLVDLYVLAADGTHVEDSASQHMLRLGWPIYEKR